MAFAASLTFASTAAAAEGGAQVLFVQQDTVQAFDFGAGKGYQTGTATGQVNGTSFVDFQFIPLGPPDSNGVLPIAFSNTVVITDIDGDQLVFTNEGIGSFHLAPPFIGTGGPLRGTYVLTSGTGKYSSWKVGSTLTYKAIATNPPTPPGGLGTVYVEVSIRGRDDLK